MKKSKLVIIAIVMIAICSTVIYLNYDNIVKYITNREWEIADSIAKINIDNYLAVSGTNSNLIIINSDDIKLYTNSLELKTKIDYTVKNPVYSSSGEYCVIGEKGESKICLINEETKIWDMNITGSILNVSVNKNGYVVIMYTQSGYKSLVKVIKPDGTELFTSYLASTYAIDADISNDNKTLAIAEINADGIKMQSSIKIIHIDKIDEQQVNVINLGDGVLVIDIEFNNKNDLLILEDNKVELIKSSGELIKISEYSYSDTSFSTISESGNAITVNKSGTGIFDIEYILKICNISGDVQEYVLPNNPKQVATLNKIIAVDLGSEILFINMNGKLIKRCKLSGQIKHIELFSNGNLAGIIFRNRVELLKI